MSETLPGGGRHAAVLALAEQMLAIDSVTGEERELCDWIEQRLRAVDPWRLLRAENSLCVVPRELDPSRSTLMLIGHLDTVPGHDHNPVRRQGDRLFGLGASDMQAADAVLLSALERARRHPARHNLVGVLYSREEGSFDTSEMPLVYAAARPFFDATDLAVCLEPTDNRIELGCLGTCHAQVVFTGTRAHSARPWQGENAIHKAAGLLLRLADWGRRECVFDGLKFYEVMSATTAASRGARNVVPDRFELNVNFRFAPDRDAAAVRAELTRVVGDQGSFEIVDFCPAGRVCGDNRLLAELRVAGGDPEVCAKQAWTDVGRLSHLGIDAINWGPGATSQAHQAGEWVSVAAVVAAIETLERWLW